MKICIAVSEFNPFHAGHAHFLQQCRTLTGADAVVCAMSGNFTQRGDLACEEKRKRAAVAVAMGADAVIELPSSVAVAPAERFARGAISLFQGVNAELCLCFGTEYGEQDLFLEAAEFFSKEPKEYQAELKKLVKEGLPLPAAREKALAVNPVWQRFLPLVQNPNATLGLEYAKACRAAKIELYCYPRTGDYNDEQLPKAPLTQGGVAVSARAIRTALSQGKREEAKTFLPAASYEALPDQLPNADLALYSAVLSCGANGLKKLPDCSEGLENRILSAVQAAQGWEDFLQKVKTKRYVLSRIKRIAACAFLGVEEPLSCQTAKKAPYKRLLAVKKGREDVLSALSGGAPLLTRAKDVEGLSPTAKQSFAADQKAEALFRFLTGEEYPFFLSV
ncbi:MAG: nucleotidyltransferase family protein [Clostridia bacterium]|nr:nucleotidyltransferase family protein [Clostridia bacterium]